MALVSCDVFLLHLECGQRVSDLAKLLTGNYKVKQGKKYKYIVVSTMKENIKAIIPITPKVTMLMDKIKNHSLVNPVEFEKRHEVKATIHIMKRFVGLRRRQD